jgi:hypothetical protein
MNVKKSNEKTKSSDVAERSNNVGESLAYVDVTERPIVTESGGRNQKQKSETRPPKSVLGDERCVERIWRAWAADAVAGRVFMVRGAGKGFRVRGSW